MDILASLHRADLHLLGRWFRFGEKKFVVPLARVISRSADGYLHVALPLLLLALPVAGGAEFVLLLALGLMLERPCYWLLKNSLRRHRPQQSIPGFRSLIVAADQFSFPSGHTSGAFLLTTCLCLVFGGPCAVMLLWALGVAFSRVVLGVHYPGDTLAGALMGSGCAVAAAAITGVM